MTRSARVEPFSRRPIACRTQQFAATSHGPHRRFTRVGESARMNPIETIVLVTIIYGVAWLGRAAEQRVANAPSGN